MRLLPLAAVCTTPVVAQEICSQQAREAVQEDFGLLQLRGAVSTYVGHPGHPHRTGGAAPEPLTADDGGVAAEPALVVLQGAKRGKSRAGEGAVNSSVEEETAPGSSGAAEETATGSSGAAEETAPGSSGAAEETAAGSSSAEEETAPGSSSAEEGTVPANSSAAEEGTAPANSSPAEETATDNSTAPEETVPTSNSSATEETVPANSSVTEETVPANSSATDETVPSGNNSNPSPGGDADTRQTIPQAPLVGSDAEPGDSGS